jgi:hypothetical protein
MLSCPEDSFLCVLSLDFAEAFDKMSHTYLFEILRSYSADQRLHVRSDINPLIQCLGKNLQGLRFDKGQRKVEVVAYHPGSGTRGH